MQNELIFIVHSFCISGATLVATYLGAEALVTLICTFCLFANIFVIKQIMLFGFNATGSDAFTIGATLGLNLLQEYYGKKIARLTIIINFFILLIYVIMSQIHLWYDPSLFDTTQEHFQRLLLHTPRIIITSFIVYFLTQSLDYYLYGFLKKRWLSRFFVIRNYASMVVSQLFDTITFSFLGLYGIVDNIGEIIIVSYSIKIIVIFLNTPCIALSRYIKLFPKRFM